MQASRLLSIQMLLQSRGRMSARALADALEVSVRTVHRDVEQLSAAGVPVYADRGRAGGFALMEGWKTTLTGLTPGESQAVFLAGLAGPAAQLGLGEQVKAAQLKLLAALPSAWREQSQVVSARLHLDPVEWYREQEPVPFLSLVAQAVWQGRVLSLRYDSWKGTALREVAPLGLVLKAGVWYVVGLLGGEPRTFRVSSILHAQVRDEAVRRPRGFDLARWWGESIRRFERELYTGQATVLASSEGLKALRYLSAAVARVVAEAPASRRRDGRVRLRIPIESVGHASGQLLRLAPMVEVVEPAELRQAMVQRIRQAAVMYGA